MSPHSPPPMPGLIFSYVLSGEDPSALTTFTPGSSAAGTDFRKVVVLDVTVGGTLTIQTVVAALPPSVTTLQLILPRTQRPASLSIIPLLYSPQWELTTPLDLPGRCIPSPSHLLCSANQRVGWMLGWLVPCTAPLPYMGFWGNTCPAPSCLSVVRWPYRLETASAPVACRTTPVTGHLRGAWARAAGCPMRPCTANGVCQGGKDSMDLL